MELSGMIKVWDFFCNQMLLDTFQNFLPDFLTWFLALYDAVCLDTCTSAYQEQEYLY